MKGAFVSSERERAHEMYRDRWLGTLPHTYVAVSERPLVYMCAGGGRHRAHPYQLSRGATLPHVCVCWWVGGWVVVEAKEEVELGKLYYGQFPGIAALTERI